MIKDLLLSRNYIWVQKWSLLMQQLLGVWMQRSEISKNILQTTE